MDDSSNYLNSDNYSSTNYSLKESKKIIKNGDIDGP